ncbi:MAG: hypothetical protein AAGF57_13275 [Pseudomonadota bacterium]
MTIERIIVADDWQLLLPDYVQSQIWTPARALRDYVGGIGALLNVCTCLYDYDGRLYFPNGRPWHHEDIDDIFGDHGERWLRNFLTCDEAEEGPKFKSTKFERLRALHGTVQIIAQTKPWAAE